jgi:putative acetyltransferase
MGYNGARHMQRSITVQPEPPDSPDASAMVEELEAHLASLYPAESRHGFTVERLVAMGVRFFVARFDSAAAGCGGILFVDDPADPGGPYGEIKRMYVRPAYRGRGIGKRVLDRLVDEARGREVALLRLETGIDQVEAIALYERAGFRRCPPFGPYRDDPLSPCFELRLERPTSTRDPGSPAPSG